MITYQRLLLSKINQIIRLNSNTLNGLVSYNFSSDEGKNNKYEVPFNFNREQYRGYIKKVQKAKQQANEIEKMQQGQVVPRRKRRLYDRPKHDTDQTGYAVWRLFDPEQTQMKLHQHSMDVLAKIKLQPKWVVHAFGKGIISINNRLSCSREYIFEDNNLSKFILYEYRNTTHYRKNIPDYDYENQDHIRPEMRKVKRLEPSDFWQSEEFFEFRVNATVYAQHLKFCKWITETIEKRKTQESYDQIIDKKFGKAMCFNEKQDIEQFQPRSPFIMHVNPQSFEIQKEKEEKPAAKGKKQKKGQAKVETKVQPTPLSQEPAQPKSNYNFAYQLEEQFRKQYKPEQKKAKSTDF